jgi:hypothetical protein
MTTLPPQTYEQLHFKQYLDGGSRRLTFLNWRALQLEMPSCSNPFPAPPTHAPIPKREDGWLVAGYSHVCQQLLGRQVMEIGFPGGSHRSSCRLLLDDGTSVIATRRLDADRALFESLVMRRLERLAAPTPRHYAFNGLVLLQEELSGIRLSTALQQATEPQYTSWMAAALESLANTQHLAERDGLSHAVPVLGCEPEWLIGLIDRTALLGNYLGVRCPPVPVRQYFDRLLLLKPCFVKWDARPGNAMLGDDGKVKWFDWEHCCARNPMDDMAWLLCDDSVPDYPAAENHLIERYLPDFADGRNLEDAQAYLTLFGVHHVCVRLCRLLDEKGHDTWPAYAEYLRSQSQSAITLSMAQRLCTRAFRWAGKHPMTAMLQDWLLEIAERLPRI